MTLRVGSVLTALLFGTCLATGARGAVVCNPQELAALTGCPAVGGACTIIGDVEFVCDASCGTECVFDFGPDAIRHFRGPVFRSTGPAMHFVGLIIAFLSSGGDFGTGFGSPFTSVPGVVGPVGGFVSFETILELGRPIRVPGGLVQLGGAGVLGVTTRTTRATRHATVDVSDPAGGGTIQFVGDNSTFNEVNLLAKGSREGPGGTLIAPLGGRLDRGKRIDVSGSTGGTVAMGWTDRRMRLHARGITGDGGSVTFDTIGNPPALQVVNLGSCLDKGHPRMVLRGKAKGGSLTIRSPRAVEICNTIDVTGRKGGGTIDIQAHSIRLRKVRARGSRAHAGGVVKLIDPNNATFGGIFVESIDVRGSPGGTVELRSNNGAAVRDVDASAKHPDADAGTIYLGELNDPPMTTTCVAPPQVCVPTKLSGSIRARSKRGSGGSVTFRGCKVSQIPDVQEIDVSGGGAGGTILLQSRHDIWLPERLIATGPGGSVDAEYGGLLLFVDLQLSDPPVQGLQYPNPSCNCNKTLAECMTAP